MESSGFRSLVSAVEQFLSSYYRFTPRAEAADYVLSRNEVQAALGSQALNHTEWAAKGATWLVQDEQDEFFLGIHFKASILDRLTRQNPMQRLCDQNIAEFCVVVEEVSHFHLILNRISSNRHVSRTELEYQGEIDKFLLCAIFLGFQCGDAHLLPLARRLFDCAHMAPGVGKHYDAANNLAARFWYRRIPYLRSTTNQLFADQIRSILQENYQLPWQEKTALVV